MAKTMTCKQRLYLTADRDSLVGEDSTDRAFLYASPGDIIPESAHELFGLDDGGLPKGKDSVRRKDRPAPADKERKGGANKGGANKGGDKGGAAKRGKVAKGKQATPPAPPQAPALTAVAGVGEATAKLLIDAGIADTAALAAVDPVALPTIEGLHAAFDWKAAIDGARTLMKPAEPAR